MRKPERCYKNVLANSVRKLCSSASLERASLMGQVVRGNGDFFAKGESASGQRIPIPSIGNGHRSKTVAFSNRIDRRKGYQTSALTLVELILSIVFLSVIILAASTFNYTSILVFNSSHRKAAILNEMSLVLEHLAKYTSMATGDAIGNANSKGIVVGPSNKWVNIRIDENNPQTPSKYSDDTWVRYQFVANNSSDLPKPKPHNGNGYTIRFCSDWNTGASSCSATWYTITSRIVTDKKGNPDPKFFLGSYPNELLCAPFTLRYDPAKPEDVRKNPEVYRYDNVTFTSSSYSIN